MVHEGYGLRQCVAGDSVIMRHLMRYVSQIAKTDSNILITGETGTGKEMMATVIHELSTRAHRPFVAVSCASLPESLIEAELFGHERGAFTGATSDRKGRFGAADGGTIFLDDIDDVSLHMQVKLLRVLQTGSVQPLGCSRSVSVNVRTVTSTKRDLRELVANGGFRDDLFYRLNVIPLTLPPLRDRKEDIPQLVDHFVKQAALKYGYEPPAVSVDVLDIFTKWRWPGNVRELENACERYVQLRQMGDDYPLSVRDLFGDDIPTTACEVVPSLPANLKRHLADIERDFIDRALRLCEGNKAKAAQLLGLRRSTFVNRILALRIPVAPFSHDRNQEPRRSTRSAKTGASGWYD